MHTLLPERHPLTTLLARNNWTAAAYLHRVAARHRALGFGAMATRREKLTRWTRSGTIPQRSAQLAIASLHGIDPAEVDRRGWPDFLLLALDDDRVIVESPWTPAGTVEVLMTVGAPVDRRGFLMTSTSALAAALAQWTTATPATASMATSGRRIGLETAELFDTRLAALRHLDDTVGARQVYDAAMVELRLITDTLIRASYSTATAHRLFACAAEAARLAGWCAYDAGRHASAERHFITSLRAAGNAQDTTLGAITLAFWANLRYTAGDPRSALHLIDGALADRRRISSPRVLALLHARAARAHSTAGEPAAAWRQVDAAFAAYAAARLAEEDQPSLYWINHGELHQFAASSALTLGEPKRALEHFTAATTHHDPYDTTREARGTAIYLARQAEAHLALGDVDSALDVANQVIGTVGGVDSVRATSASNDLRNSLSTHQHIPAIRELLEGL